MNLRQLERAEELRRLAQFLGCTFAEACIRSDEDAAFSADAGFLIDHGQFQTLLHLKRAQALGQYALEGLTHNTEYLRDELEQHLHRLQVLLDKMEAEEHLRRDREVLLSPDPADPEQGVASWISGRTTD